MGKDKGKFYGGGLVLFADVQQALKGEKSAREGGYIVKLVAPPPQLRRGCDLAVEINLVELLGIERLYKEKGVDFVEIQPLNIRTSGLLDVVKITDFGKWLMIKAGNMKLTFEKESGTIVNTSGGGCPDIPSLHASMVGKNLADVESPRETGLTLCALMLNRAYREAFEKWENYIK